MNRYGLSRLSKGKLVERYMALQDVATEFMDEDQNVDQLVDAELDTDEEEEEEEDEESDDEEEEEEEYVPPADAKSRLALIENIVFEIGRNLAKSGVDVLAEMPLLKQFHEARVAAFEEAERKKIEKAERKRQRLERQMARIQQELQGIPEGEHSAEVKPKPVRRLRLRGNGKKKAG